jgi:exopolysaccharide biosynthesis polyprenyl glycosylphosphotransferase
MISYRLRGLVHLHVAATVGVATGYFLVLALGVHYLPKIDLSADVNLIIYATPILIGMALTGRFWAPLSPRFHAITWADALGVASRQILLVALLMFALIVATKDRSVSRLFLAFYLVSCTGLLVLVNRLLPAYLARIAFHRAHKIPTLFVGPHAALGRLGEWIRQKEHLGISVVGILSDEPLSDTTAPFVTRLGGMADLAKVTEAHGIGQVILLGVPEKGAETIRIVEACQGAGCRLLIYEDVFDRLPLPMMPVVEQEHIFLTLQDEPLEDPFHRGIKRLYDIAVSLPVVVVVLPPLWTLVWLVQRVQAPGPLMFKRMRGGQRGREFGMLKFRSMYAATADAKREAQQARKGDARIYPFGRFLRRTSLDEFPQFWNVLVGEMSIVGPRPHLPQHDVEFAMLAKTYRTRQLVKPGITGLAQVSGYRGEITDPEVLKRRVSLDIEYITHWSIWLDVHITMRTLRHVLFPPKAAV